MVVGFGGSFLAIPFVLGGIQALIKGQDNGGTLVGLGLTLLVVSIAVPWLIMRRWGAALMAVHPLSVQLPFGAVPRGDGVSLRARAAIRIVPGVLVPLMVFVVLGMSLDGVNSIAVWIVGGLTVAVLVVWLWIRRYELCMDRCGVWRRRAPRWRLAWQDLERTEVLATPKSGNQVRPDDLVLHGLVARPGGKVTRSVRLRMNVLAISTTDLQRLAEHFADQPPTVSTSPFESWR